MKIKLYRLASRNSIDLKKDDDNFIEEINNLLFDHDLELSEDADSKSGSIIFVESGGTEEKFLKLLPKIKAYPIILLSTNKNNSLPACLEINTYLLQKTKIPCLIASEGPNMSAELIRIISEVSVTFNKLQNNNLGVVIGESSWLIASHIDYSLIKEKFNLNIIKIGKQELLDEIKKKKVGKVPHLQTLMKKCRDKVELQKALYIYGALKRLCVKYKLDGLTIKCFDLLDDYKSTACLALSLLNDEGITAGCEGDIPSLITMHFVNALTDRPSFMANPSKISHENNTILLAHCTCPINMFSSYKINTHFESGIGLATEGEFNHTDVSLIKISPDLKNVTAIRGEIKSDSHLKEYCRTQALVSVEPHELDMLFLHPFGNHIIMTYGDVIDPFLALVNLYLMLYKGK